MEIKTRYIPTGYVLYPMEDETFKEVLQIYINKEKLCKMSFRGKQSRPVYHYRYRSENDLINSVKKEIDEAISLHISRRGYAEKRKEEKNKEMDSIQVGTLLVYSWGYDQTNIDFYQVIEKKGKTFKMRRICGTRLNEYTYCSMSANVIPNKDDFFGDEIITKHSLSMEFGCLSITEEGIKHYSSWYA